MVKVSLLGPMPPFRGGIARHSERLARELASRADVSFSAFTFSNLYPAWLYPGQDQLDPELPPSSASAVVDSIWPLSWRRAAQAIAHGRPDILIMPAWTFFVAPALGWIAARLRRKGTKVAMIVHNAEDHEGAGWKRRLLRYQLAQADALVTHNQALADNIRAQLPAARISVAPHPVYDDYPAATGALKREAGLELIFFGLIRRYKGLDIALRAVAASRIDDIRLTVVGEFWESRSTIEELIKSLGLASRVELVPRYVSDQDAAEYFDRADAVLLPYRAASGSGVVALAMHYRRPSIVSDVPGLAHAIRDGETGWLFPADDYQALAKLLQTGVSRQKAAAMAPALEDEARRLSWQRFADAVLESLPRETQKLNSADS